MRKIRDFKCEDCNNRFEQWVEDEDRVIECDCGGMAHRQLSAPKCFQNTTGKSPSSSNRR